MISLRSLSVPMFALVAVLAGCSTETSSTTGPSTASSQQSAVVAQNGAAATTDATAAAGPHRGPGGEMLIGAALHDDALNLTAAQKTTIQGLHDSLKADRPAFDQTHAAALAAAIRAGDLSTLQPPQPDQAKMQAHLADATKALQTLHDTLSADQRAQLVSDVQNHALKGKGDGPAFGKRGDGAMMHEGGVGGPFLEGLNLTDAQKAQLQASAPPKPTDAEIVQRKANAEAMRTAMNAKLETFKGDSFDATAFITPPTNAQKPAGADGHMQRLANLVKVLTPAQREQLAQKIEAGPPAMPAQQ